MRLSRLAGWCHSIYSRITLTRVTTFFFVFSLLHCLFQGIVQSVLYSLDNDQRAFLSAIVVEGGIPRRNTTFLEGSVGRLDLQICSDIPYGQNPYPCTTIFSSSLDTPKQTDPVRTFYRGDSAVLINKAVGLDGVVLRSISNPGSIYLDLQCVQILVHPEQRLTNARREDIAFVALQFWLLSISVFAIVNDSVPHLLTVVITRLLFAAWSMYAVWRTKYDEAVYKELLSNPGTPCYLDVFSPYFETRFAIQVTDLVMASVALLVAMYLSHILLKTYNSQAFMCVGAPPQVHKVNKYFMALLACLQLEVFILVAGMSMWIDVLLNTAIAKISAHTPEYIAVFTTSAVVRCVSQLVIYHLPDDAILPKLLLPWITMGWYAIKLENRRLTVAFLAIAFIIIVGWSVMFYSIVYRWTFLQWPFLGVFTVASLFLLTASIVLGIACRLNFGKGHAEYLQAEAALASLNFTKEVFTRNEKRESFDLTEPSKIYYVTTNAAEDIHGLPRLSKIVPAHVV